MSNPLVKLGLLLGLAVFAATESVGHAETPPAVDFENDVLPILRDRCFDCHGRAKREAGLRFFGAADLTRENESGLAAVVPHKSGESELIRRVTSDDERMPPEGKPLSAEQIDLLRRWIDAGAEWPASLTIGETHWSYVAPKRPTLPTVEHPAWCRNEIDYFTLKRMQDAGLQPSIEATEETLLRRVSLDLIGLPPTLEQLEQYRNSTDPAKYERFVDQLLASPQYGVKWARHWLDLARYADSNGYQADQFREIWPYRDWVIASMNVDMPFDQFTIEQLAGDLLPDATLSQKIATGFQRCTTCNVEAGVDPEENRVNQIVDRVNTTGTVWLGTSLDCAQCHNHKYDPFTMEDYYSLFAFYNNTPLEVILPDNKGVQYEVAGPTMPLPLTDEQAQQKAALESRKEKINEQLTARKSQLASERDAFVANLTESLDEQPTWHVLPIESFHAEGNPTTETLDDGSLLLSGENPAKATYEITVRTDIAKITGFKLETLTHDSLPGNGPGRGNAKLPNFVLYEFDVSVDGKPVALTNPAADFSQSNWDVAGLIDGQPQTGWGINPQFGKNHWATFQSAETLNQDGGEIAITFRLPQNYGGSRTIGRLRLSAMTGQAGAQSIPQDVRKALVVDAETRNKKQLAAIENYQHSLDADCVKLNKDLQQVNSQLAAIKPITTLVMTEMDETRATNVMKRGNFLDPGTEVTAAVPQALHEIPDDAPRDRLGLARWLVAPENPLVRRVVVNRWWGEIFGEPIVRTPEDFGMQGELPTHPELLDWLADELLQSGWSMKAIHRKIVTSATYRQSSRLTPDLLERDPFNKLLARGPRFRLSAETIRDNALRISGLLSEGMGGPPIYPPQPANLWRHVGRNAPKFNTDADERRFRRGVYVVWRRSAPYPSFVNFDAPDRASCVVNRSRTNTPLQALTLLNDPVYVEITQAFVKNVFENAPSADLDSRFRYAFESCTGRKPTESEIRILADIHRDETARLRDNPDDAKKLAPDKDLSDDQRLERAVWFSLGNILLNLDETITKQ